jgi:uncharacterized protein (TIGR03067 family)
MLRRPLALCSALAALLALAAAPPSRRAEPVAAAGPALADTPKGLAGPARRELKALEGRWRVVRFLHADRETTPGTGAEAVVVTFKGDAIDFNGSAKGAIVALDPATDPKCLDFEAQVGSGVFKKGSTYESVYKRDGDKLTWAVYHGREKNRPTSLDKPTDPGVMVMVIARVKE